MPSPIELGNDGAYWYVDLGPIPNVPDWHVQSQGTSYPFPTEKAALTFAHVHQLQEPNREIRVRRPGELPA